MIFIFDKTGSSIATVINSGAAKIYYETDEFDLLEAHLEAMKNFIRRKRIIGYHQRNYQHIIQITRKLLNINIFDKKEMAVLEDLIGKAEPLTEKEWLLTQLQNIRA